MPREYRHIEQYESEIIKLKEEGYTHREIGEKIGLTKKQIKGFFSRYHRKQAKIAAGVILRKKGRPPKKDIEDYVQDEALRKAMQSASKVEKGHGRIESRTAFVTQKIAWLTQKTEWKKLICIGAVNTKFESQKGRTSEWHYYGSTA